MKAIMESVKKEVIIGEGGVAWFSQSGIARLCGVTQQAINKRVEALQPYSQKMMQPFDSGAKAATAYSDITVAKFIEYYAFDSKSANDIAIATFRAFATIGIRTFFQNELGYGDDLIQEKSKGVYKENCKNIKSIFQPIDEIPYIKCATIARKAVAIRWGLEKSIPKDSMTPAMMTTYDEAHKLTVAAYKLFGCDAKVKELVYTKYSLNRLREIV